MYHPPTYIYIYIYTEEGIQIERVDIFVWHEIKRKNDEKSKYFIALDDEKYPTFEIDRWIDGRIYGWIWKEMRVRYTDL